MLGQLLCLPLGPPVGVLLSLPLGVLLGLDLGRLLGVLLRQLRCLQLGLEEQALLVLLIGMLLLVGTQELDPALHRLGQPQLFDVTSLLLMEQLRQTELVLQIELLVRCRHRGMHVLLLLLLLLGR